MQRRLTLVDNNHMQKRKEKDQGFEESLNSLEEIVQQLESGELPLEKALELFEEGVVLARRCQSQLEEAERRVDLLLRERKEIKVVPFDQQKATAMMVEPARAPSSDDEVDEDGEKEGKEGSQDDSIPF